MTSRRLSRAFWIEAGLGSVAAFLLLLRFAWPDWVEGIFGLHPDGNSGSFEWSMVIACAAVTLVFVALAGREWAKATRASWAAVA